MTAPFPFAWSDDASAATAARDVGRALAAKIGDDKPALGLVYVADAHAADIDAIVAMF